MACFCTGSALFVSDAFFSVDADFYVRILTLRIGTPDAAERTSLQEKLRAESRSVMDREPLNIEYIPFHSLFSPAPSFLSVCIIEKSLTALYRVSALFPRRRTPYFSPFKCNGKLGFPQQRVSFRAAVSAIERPSRPSSVIFRENCPAANPRISR